MTTIFKGQTAPFTVTVQADGKAIAIDPSATVTAQLFSLDGTTSLTSLVTCVPATTGANWGAGVVGVSFNGTEIDAIPLGATLLVLTSTAGFAVKRFKVTVSDATVLEKSSLFIKDFVVDELRSDQLVLMAQSVFSAANLTDDYLWSKVLAAEASMKHTLRVPLVPTQFFPTQPTDDDLAALPAGMPWEIDPPYDHDPAFFDGDRWGFLVTNNRPLISVSMMRFAYPSPVSGIFDVPSEWLRVDQKYGQIRIVPTSLTISFPLAAFMLTAVSSGRVVPQMVELTYVAGLADARKDYPELLDAIKKMAVLLIIQDAFLPQSGSISADGLSQSMSIDMEKYRDTIDSIINGPKGSNGGLMTAIHGIRSMVMG